MNRMFAMSSMEQREILPYGVQDKGSDGIITSFVLKLRTEINPTLMFYTSHQEVYVYADDQLIYSDERADSIYGHSTGTVWHFVKLPMECQELKVVTYPVFKEVAGKVPTFYYGDGRRMYKDTIVSSLPSMVICILICCLGLCLLIFYFLVCKQAPEQHDVLDLGVFSILLGIWSFGETTGAALLLEKRVMASYTGFTCLMFFGIPFVLFIRNFLKSGDQWFYKGIIDYYVIVIVGSQLMQFLGIRDIKQNAIWIHLGIVWLALYSVYATVLCVIRRKNLRRVALNTVGLVILIGTTAMDMMTYYSDRVNMSKYGKLGFLVYIIILGIDTALTTKKNMDKQRKLEFYKELALMDMQTHCYNRNAFNSDSEKLAQQMSCQLVTFDLNNLKKCNDILGHNNGDAYIEESAELIRRVFGDYGKVYRIGGDEFCVISRKLSIPKIQSLIQQLNEEEKQCKFYHMGEVPLRVACGYAEYDASLDKDIEDTRNRADEIMYKNKEELKGGIVYER